MTTWMLDAVAAFPHAIIGPIVLPLMLGATLVLIERVAPKVVGPLSLMGAAALVLLNMALLAQASSGHVSAYLLGNWQAPFGIALALDRLSALMLLLTSVLGFIALLYARDGADQRSPHFHAFFQFQLMGLNGAFLTADLFNLFVFFEVLLISSYALLLHGAGPDRLKASVHYITFNLAGSALFLVAVSLLYALTGTLNMADLAIKVAALPASDAALVKAAGLMLMGVFCIKAALLPLYFWLPSTYGSATAPVAALFAIMTKVGLYSVMRTSTLIFGPDAGPAALIAQPWLAVLAGLTLALGAAGALQAQQLRTVAAYTVVASAGFLLLAVGLGSVNTLAAGLFYLVNSTLAAGLVFLLADRIAAARPGGADRLAPAPFGPERAALAVLFAGAAVAAAGLPPMSGFFGKALLLQASAPLAQALWVWPLVLLSSLLMVVAYARAGAALFWASPAQHTRSASAGAGTTTSVWMALVLLVAVSVSAGPLAAYARATAAQLAERQTYIRAVLQQAPVAPAWDIRREMNQRIESGGPK
jgi:multicomponent K+:H+ antiporter subunit D